MRKDKTIHLGQVECIAINFMRLFITFQGIHLEQVKGEAADFHPSPDFLSSTHGHRSRPVCRNPGLRAALKSPVAYGSFSQS